MKRNEDGSKGSRVDNRTTKQNRKARNKRRKHIGTRECAERQNISKENTKGSSRRQREASPCVSAQCRRLPTGGSEKLAISSNNTRGTKQIAFDATASRSRSRANSEIASSRACRERNGVDEDHNEDEVEEEEKEKEELSEDVRDLAALICATRRSNELLNVCA